MALRACVYVVYIFDIEDFVAASLPFFLLLLFWMCRTLLEKLRFFIFLHYTYIKHPSTQFMQCVPMRSVWVVIYATSVKTQHSYVVLRNNLLFITRFPFTTSSIYTYTMQTHIRAPARTHTRAKETKTANRMHKIRLSNWNGAKIYLYIKNRTKKGAHMETHTHTLAYIERARRCIKFSSNFHINGRVFDVVIKITFTSTMEQTVKSWNVHYTLPNACVDIRCTQNMNAGTQSTPMAMLTKYWNEKLTIAVANVFV